MLENIFIPIYWLLLVLGQNELRMTSAALPSLKPEDFGGVAKMPMKRDLSYHGEDLSEFEMPQTNQNLYDDERIKGLTKGYFDEDMPTYANNIWRETQVQDQRAMDEMKKPSLYNSPEALSNQKFMRNYPNYLRVSEEHFPMPSKTYPLKNLQTSNQNGNVNGNEDGLTEGNGDENSDNQGYIHETFVDFVDSHFGAKGPHGLPKPGQKVTNSNVGGVSFGYSFPTPKMPKAKINYKINVAYKHIKANPPAILHEMKNNKYQQQHQQHQQPNRKQPNFSNDHQGNIMFHEGSYYSDNSGRTQNYLPVKMAPKPNPLLKQKRNEIEPTSSQHFQDYQPERNAKVQGDIATLASKDSKKPKGLQQHPQITATTNYEMPQFPGAYANKNQASNSAPPTTSAPTTAPMEDESDDSEEKDVEGINYVIVMPGHVPNYRMIHRKPKPYELAIYEQLRRARLNNQLVTKGKEDEYQIVSEGQSEPQTPVDDSIQFAFEPLAPAPKPKPITLVHTKPTPVGISTTRKPNIAPTQPDAPAKKIDVNENEEPLLRHLREQPTAEKRMQALFQAFYGPNPIKGGQPRSLYTSSQLSEALKFVESLG